MKCFNGECHTQELNECLVFDDKKECIHFIPESEQPAAAPVDSLSAGSVCSADHAKQLGEEWNWCWKCGEALDNKPNDLRDL